MDASGTTVGPVLRVATAGSVDDGKSTLIGRLLHDSRAVLADQLAAVGEASRRRGLTEPNLAFLTDGLRAEREQGITIDVAYRYFDTAHRTIVLADTPGHVQYTRNMVTGASTADAAVLLVDARAGIVEQTRRHAAVLALLQVPHVVLAVNKMDAVLDAPDAGRGVFDAVVAAFRSLRARPRDVTAIPLSALDGDNVVRRSTRMSWYDGATLLEHLEGLPSGEGGLSGARLPVQTVIRHGDYRGFAGRVSGASLRVGDEVVVLPGTRRTVVESIDTYDGPLQEACAGRSVSVRLAHDIDVGRGTVLAAAADQPAVLAELTATVCVLADRTLRAGDELVLMAGTREVPAMITTVDGRLSLASGAVEPADELGENDLGVVVLQLAEPVAVDSYDRNRSTGGMLLVGPGGVPVAACLAAPTVETRAA
jgi:sulfate adenylyltransferase subunit 1